MKDNDVINYCAMKPSDEPGFLTRCDWDDPGATEFSLIYVGMPYSSSTLDFNSQHQAEEIARALHRVFRAGHKSARHNMYCWLKHDTELKEVDDED